MPAKPHILSANLPGCRVLHGQPRSVTTLRLMSRRAVNLLVVMPRDAHAGTDAMAPWDAVLSQPDAPRPAHR